MAQLPNLSLPQKDEQRACECFSNFLQITCYATVLEYSKLPAPKLSFHYNIDNNACGLDLQIEQEGKMVYIQELYSLTMHNKTIGNRLLLIYNISTVYQLQMQAPKAKCVPCLRRVSTMINEPVMMSIRF